MSLGFQGRVACSRLPRLPRLPLVSLHSLSPARAPLPSTDKRHPGYPQPQPITALPFCTPAVLLLLISPKLASTQASECVVTQAELPVACAAWTLDEGDSAHHYLVTVLPTQPATAEFSRPPHGTLTAAVDKIYDRQTANHASRTEQAEEGARASRWCECGGRGCDSDLAAQRSVHTYTYHTAKLWSSSWPCQWPPPLPTSYMHYVLERSWSVVYSYLRCSSHDQSIRVGCYYSTPQKDDLSKDRCARAAVRAHSVKYRDRLTSSYCGAPHCGLGDVC